MAALLSLPAAGLDIDLETGIRLLGHFLLFEVTLEKEAEDSSARSLAHLVSQQGSTLFPSPVRASSARGS